jgi:hypothetical protein
MKIPTEVRCARRIADFLTPRRKQGGALIELMLKPVFSINTLESLGFTLSADEFSPIRGVFAACQKDATGRRLRAIKPSHPQKGNVWNMTMSI